jgi:uncharacterized protein (TIGR02145 family)
MKAIGTTLLFLVLAFNLATAQDTLFIYQSGSVVAKRAINDIDSMVFHNGETQTTVVDVDGNVYHTVKIGTQVWMVENLKTTKFNDGTPIPNVTSNNDWLNLKTPAYCWYYNEIVNKDTYGALYNWYTVQSGKLCPTGWHVPTDAEWSSLENYLIQYRYNYDGTNMGTKYAKSLAATTNWNPDSGEGTVGNDLTLNNKTGFTGLPGGGRTNLGVFHNIGYYANWWCSTEYRTELAWFRDISYYSSSVFSNYELKAFGFSVRCIRDN